ncbi:MAG: hypothetical protein RL735_670, partial [Pseudomonadota bacterium]
PDHALLQLVPRRLLQRKARAARCQERALIHQGLTTDETGAPVIIALARSTTAGETR